MPKIIDQVDLGQFEVVSGKITCSDPCYSPGTWCSGEVKAKNGKWKAFVIRSDEEEWGTRIAQLVVFHESFEVKPDDLGRLGKETGIDGGVDSGQFGFFDEGHYQDEGLFMQTNNLASAARLTGMACAATER